MSGDAEPGKAKAAGIVSIVIAILALGNMICGFINVALGAPDGSGLWSGFGQMLVAILGIVTWIKLSKAVFVAHLVFGILWLIITIVQVVICLIAWLVWYIIRKVVEEKCTQDDSRDLCVCDADKSVPFTVHNCGDIKVIESCFIAMVILNALLTCVIFAATIIGCCGTCCAKPTSTTNVVVVTQPGMVMQHTSTNQQAPPEYPVKY